MSSEALATREPTSLVKHYSILPDGWKEVALGDVAAVNPTTLRAATPSDFRFGYIDISQITGPGHCAGWSEMSFGDAPSRARRQVQGGDILVSTVRPYLRSFARVPEADLPLVASTGFAVVRAGEQADQQFLYQHILHSSFIGHLTPRMTGSNYPAVSASDVEAYPIPLPPLDEQRRIAEVLRSVDEAVAAAGAALDQARTARDHLVTALLHLGGYRDRPIPEYWIGTDLGSVIDFVNGYPFKPEDWSDQGTPIIRIQNLNGSTSFNYFSGHVPERFHVATGDLLFCWSGSRGTSFGARKWNGPLGYLNQHIFRCVVSRRLNFDYAYYLLTGLTAAVENEAHGGGGLVHIKKSELVKFRAPLPPLAEQKQIAAVLLALDTDVAQQSSAFESLRSIRIAISNDLLSGRVRVPA